MRIAVISDVHANVVALEAVLAEIDAEQPDELWCLGDTVGYGPKPNECCALVAGRAAFSLCGNHDLAVVGTIDLDIFGGPAGAAARWTRDQLTDESFAWLAGLSTSGARADVQLFHASARDPVWEYVLSEEAARRSLDATTAPLVLVGHSHIPLAIAAERKRVSGGVAVGGSSVELSGKRWLVNPGSVGQPRDGDPRAAWLLLDLTAGSAEFRRTRYAIDRTQLQMEKVGLPDVLASRLSRGV